MNASGKERRKYERYATEAKIFFRVSYDLKTKVKFQVLDKQKRKYESKKYAALSKNVSAEALCFVGEHGLKKMIFCFLRYFCRALMIRSLWKVLLYGQNP